MVSNIGRIVLIVLLAAGFSGTAQAALLQYAELTLNDCDSMGCEGSTLFLSVQEEAGGSFLVTYTIDTTNYTGDRDGFNQIGFKAIKDWTSGTVLSSPTDPTQTWNPVIEGPIASQSLCSTAVGKTDKICIHGFVDVTSGGEYTWTFRIDDGTLIMDTSEWHLGAQYADGHYRATGKIISAGSQPIPEPTAALLFGMGALLVVRSTRRSR
ncbi:MAG: hypothetical protein JRE57_12750 [Deltaproteobacteria bacterium]|nr:hypothetical protein [Deltaproteobacteria bacterium]